MTIKDFDALAESGGTPAGAFRLGGRNWHVRKREDMPWSKWPDAPKGTKAEPITDDDVREYLFALLARMIVPDESEELLALLNSPLSPLTAKMAQPLLSHVTELSTGRPTKRPRSSTAGPRSTRARSGVGSTSRATARKR